MAQDAPGGVRRIVIGRGPDDPPDASSVWFDGPSPHVHTLPGSPPSLAMIDLWYTRPPAAPGVDAADRDLAVAPDPGGTLFRVVRFPPDAELPTGDDGAPARFWHATDTTDFNVVLEGELVMLYETAAGATGETVIGEVVIGTGDTMVVRGGRHAWSNRTDAVATLATVAVAEAAD